MSILVGTTMLIFYTSQISDQEKKFVDSFKPRINANYFILSQLKSGKMGSLI